MLKESPPTWDDGRPYTPEDEKKIKDGRKAQKLGDNEAQGNQKPISSFGVNEDPIPSIKITDQTEREKVRQEANKRAYDYQSPSAVTDEEANAQRLPARAARVLDQTKYKLGEFISNPNTLKYGLGAAALGGLSYAAYKKLKQNKEAKNRRN